MRELSVSNHTVLLIGGPDTGKSNFLFRAWTQIDSSTGLVEKDGLPQDVEYLQSGAEYQLRGEFAGHTSQEVQVISSIPIHPQSDLQKKALLVVPDIDGEQINRIYHARKWSYDWESLITESTAYLFFVRVNSPQTVAPLDWIACHKLYCGAPAAPPAADPQASESEKLVGKKVETPTQVVLVDWLQFILKAVHDKYPQALRPRVGVVVTAWDCVAIDFQGGPAEWIKENMPLLHQFCITNQRVFEFSFFGTSIFSGDPINDHEFREEISRTDPRKLGYILQSTNNQKTGDFTIPIAWALKW
jgi:hypothetical protein